MRRTAVARQALVKLSLLLVLALVLPTLVHWWSANGSDVVESIFSATPTTPAAIAPAPPTPVYDGCRELRAAHPGGVASLEAHNTGRRIRASPVAATSTSIYAANTRLDKDRDGLACEVVRKSKHANKP